MTGKDGSEAVTLDQIVNVQILEPQLSKNPWKIRGFFVCKTCLNEEYNNGHIGGSSECAGTHIDGASKERSRIGPHRHLHKDSCHDGSIRSSPNSLSHFHYDWLTPMTAAAGFVPPASSDAVFTGLLENFRRDGNLI